MTASIDAPLRVALAELPDGGAIEREVRIDGEPQSLVLLRSGEAVQVYLNLCPHAGRRMDWAPGRFLLEAGLLVCPSHGASFRIADGSCAGGPCRGSGLRAVAHRREGDSILIEPS